ncbi:hypothetical protein H5410_043121 [Solanum commersonii]|uniref:Uncharacterized protein n=1 Tax=Solanum commersonii TaxID=4109 RepID=A0A9J5XYB7_SOLCO|nr:hypothetical protein H5410_043121 [Solanum commersonii]
MRRGGKWKVERERHTGMTAQIGPPPTKSITILSILCALSISPVDEPVTNHETVKMEAAALLEVFEAVGF